MNLIPGDKEQHITNALISGLASARSRDNATPTRGGVEEKAKQLASVFSYQGDLRNIVTEALTSITTRMGLGEVLVDTSADHDELWVDKRKDIVWTYSNAYGKYLIEEGWSPQMAHTLKDVTKRILYQLQNPRSEGTTWSRRGLVIGHVQSGKTANYTGLIARAADTGYKFIVVVAGLHNNLRKQTQERIDSALIGRSSDPENRQAIGVGQLLSDYPHPATLTNINDDFNKRTAGRSGWKINDFSKPIILVIKKNVHTLESLHKWLKDLNASGDGRIRDVPILMIDDEADHASINTNKEELDPTKTNRLIRDILSLFSKSCYVGYTATPFANIFINPESFDADVREDLFPRDFIYCLDAPTAYFGAEKVFVDDETSDSFVRVIDDCEDLIPYKHKKDHDVADLPESLYRALDEFIIARAVRNLRGQRQKHCSMMINVSRFVRIQKHVRELLGLREERLRNAVRANYAMPESSSSKNAYMQRLKRAFDDEYSDTECSWANIKGELKAAFEHLHIYVINSKSDQKLDYSRYDKDGVGLSAIAIGGLSLSRGLTIEGLTISYMYRNTRMYDTLMQMGRWFGYRPGYEDLCRVHLSEDSINWYAHIAEASEELIRQVKRMRRDDLSPKDFGLYVRSHPDSLLVTAANKMRAGTKVVMEQSFSGRLRESYILSTDQEVNRRNFALLRDMWSSGFGGVEPVDTGKGLIFRDVATEQVVEFLRQFECHSDFKDLKSDVIDYLLKVAPKYRKSDVLLISPQSGSHSGGEFTLRNQLRAASSGSVTQGRWRIAKDRVSSRGDEKLGLTGIQIQDAEFRALDDEQTTNVSDTHYRMARGKPLLMAHSLIPRGTSFGGPIAAFGVSFPHGDYKTTIKAVANKVWVEMMRGPVDEPDDEDDYDD